MKYTLFALLLLVLVAGCAQETQQRVVACDEGFILDGQTCCEDSNSNGVCDDQEDVPEEQPVQLGCTNECDTSKLTCVGSEFVKCADTNGDGCKEYVSFKDCGQNWSCTDERNCQSEGYLMIADTLETVASTIGTYPQYVAEGDTYSAFRFGSAYDCRITHLEEFKVLSFCEAKE